MNRLLAAAAILAWVTGSLPAHACPCQGSSGPGAALTTRFQRFGASLTETTRLVHGAWDPEGEYSALGDGSMQWSEDYALALAVRPLDRVEAGVQMAYGWQSVSAPGYETDRIGFGDTTFKLRWEAIDEPMPFEKGLHYPSLAAVGSVRAPTGTVTRVEDPNQSGGVASGTTGAVGATASSQGLGTWELALALVGQKMLLGQRLQLNVSGEAAYRLADDAIGVPRKLGPRLFGQANARYIPSPLWGFGAMTDIGWEGDVEFSGQTRTGTGQRLWGIGAFVYFVMSNVNLRSGLMVRYNPPVNGLNVNAVGATSIALSFGYAL